MARKKKPKRETIHWDSCECVYCWYMFNGMDATNQDMTCSTVECPKCGKEMFLDMTIRYRCQPIKE